METGPANWLDLRLTCKILLLVVVGIFGFSWSACGQADDGPVSCPLVVRDVHGIVVHGLKPNDFESPFPVVSIKPDYRPRRIVIVLDASGSMLGDPLTGSWNLVTDLVEHAARQGGGKAQLALLVFNSEVREVVDFTQGNALVLARIHAIATDPEYKKTFVRGHTALYDALDKGLSLFSTPSQADALFVVTDAGDNMSRTTPNKLTASLLAHGVRLFAVVVAHPLGYRNRTPEELNNASDNLQGPVEKTGGSLFGPIEWLPGRHLAQVANLSEHISVAQALTHFYAGMFESDLIVVQPPLGIRRGSEWKLHFAKSSEKPVGNRIEYPTMLSACESSVSH